MTPPRKFHRLEVLLNDEEYARVSSESYSREISRGEFLRRALEHYARCQDSRIARIMPPPPKWRMARAVATISS